MRPAPLVQSEEPTFSPEEMMKIVQPYLETAKPGDSISVGPCPNPEGWWSISRNGNFIHHFAHRVDADYFRYFLERA